MRNTEFRQFDTVTLKLLAASVILCRNPISLFKEISDIVVDCDCDSEGYHSPEYADPNEMGLREILYFNQSTPQFIRKFVKI
jgi:hypothetical protein